MIPPHSTSRPRAAAARALGLAEAVVAVFVVSLALVAALQAAGGATVAQARAAERTRARLLADALLGEILTLEYEDPAAPAKLFGPEAGESATSRTNYNDVDDFNGWVESPPRDRSGAEMPNLAGWSRDVRVAWVSPANPNQTSATETGAKRITVTVKRNGTTLATRTAIRTRR
jgi:hypothetical protein